MKRLGLLLSLLLASACASAPPTLSLPPTATVAAPSATGAPGPGALTAPPAPTATLAPAPTSPPAATPTPPAPEDVTACPFTGLPTSQSRLAALRPILVQIGNSNPERPQSGLAQADLVFETLSEGGITRFSAIYYCQDAAEIAGVRSGRLIDLQLVPMFDAIFVHVGASRPVLDLFEKDQRIRASTLDYFRNHPGFTQQPEKRRPPFDVFTSTAALWDAARERGMPLPGNPPPQLTFAAAPPAGGQPAATVTIRHRSSYWVRWQWNASLGVWERYITNDAAPASAAPHLDAATGQTLTAKNVLIIRAVHQQTDIIEDSNGSRSIDVQLIGSGEAVLLRDGQLYPAAWQRARTTDWFTLTLADGTPLTLAPGNTYVHFYPTDKPLDVTAP
ncbi:MAG: DUF3048 domain-containing protein [Anaerolineales bacterium]|nr:DUF3048 domain-containing protein [Anaerolineales bacterium]